MFKKSILFALLSMVAFSASSAFANVKDTPPKCPSFSAIQSGGIDEVQYNEPVDGYFGFKESYYDTNESWGFSMGFFRTNSPEEALIKAQESLKTLAGNPQPKLYEDVWVCRYQIEGDHFAFALLPTDEGVKIKNIQRFLK